LVLLVLLVELVELVCWVDWIRWYHLNPLEKAEHRTSNIEHRTSNEKDTYHTGQSTAISVLVRSSVNLIGVITEIQNSSFLTREISERKKRSEIHRVNI
jgi:hypothetical protein